MTLIYVWIIKNNFILIKVWIFHFISPYYYNSDINYCDPSIYGKNFYGKYYYDNLIKYEVVRN